VPVFDTLLQDEIVSKNIEERLQDNRVKNLSDSDVPALIDMLRPHLLALLGQQTPQDGKYLERIVCKADQNLRSGIVTPGEAMQYLSVFITKFYRNPGSEPSQVYAA